MSELGAKVVQLIISCEYPTTACGQGPHKISTKIVQRGYRFKGGSGIFFLAWGIQFFFFLFLSFILVSEEVKYLPKVKAQYRRKTKIQDLQLGQTCHTAVAS